MTASIEQCRRLQEEVGGTVQAISDQAFASQTSKAEQEIQTWTKVAWSDPEGSDPEVS